MRRLPMLVMFVVVFTLALTACGSGDGDSESEGAEGAKIDCRADAFEGDPGLPENFPTPAEFTVTKSTEEGPTTVVIGYWESDLEEAYNELLHLLTFLYYRKPGLFMRAMILGAQGVFFNLFFLSYLVSPRTCHRFVGYIEEEAVIVAFRRHTLLPLDDCLYALQATIPYLTRSSLHRCLQRHGISQLAEDAGRRADQTAGRIMRMLILGCDQKVNFAASRC